jgi:hypothetical protein
MQTRRIIAAVVGLTCSAADGIGTPAAKAELGLDFATGLERSPIASSNYGWSFTITSSITIDGLGVWDAGSNGLIEPHDAGLWLTSTPIPEGVLITSATVSNEQSVAFGSMSPSGRWLFSSVPAVTLNPGTYTVGALYRLGPQGSYDPFVSDAFTIATVPGVQYGNPREIHNTPNLALPLNIGLNEHQGFFGPNFRVVVPEPSGSSALLVASAFLLLCGRARMVRQAASRRDRLPEDDSVGVTAQPMCEHFGGATPCRLQPSSKSGLLCTLNVLNSLRDVSYVFALIP